MLVVVFARGNIINSKRFEAAMKSLALALALFPSVVFADPQPWMKQEDPNSLGLFVFVYGECPFSKDEVNEIAEGEFLRSRISPTKDMQLNLTLSISCLTEHFKSGEVRGVALASNLRFATRIGGFHMLYEDPDYSTVLAAGPQADDKQFLLDSLRNDVGKAVTDYLRANFE